MAAGASCPLLTDAEPAGRIRGVRVVAAGEALLAPSATRLLIAEFGDRLNPPRPAPQTGHAHPA
ncbi:MAG TPA: hypothetical protein VN408_29025 [Actinoplanes sp.]|nr:hypothetical protein [Actinoplanes sp.]